MTDTRDKTGSGGVSVSASSSASVSHSSSSGGRTAHAETKTVGVPVEYKVVDQPWQPDDPATTETMLTTQGQEGWRLVTAYPDTQRERTRWIFSR